MPGDIIILYMCTKIMITWCTVSEIWCTMDGGTDGWTDGKKKWHIEVGAPPKKEIKQLLLKYKHRNNIYEHWKQQNEWTK